MSSAQKTVSRRVVFEEIRTNELARGETEDDAAQTAAARVDQVMELKRAE